ncbi:acylamino-acid-releasing enzyme [Geomicrobium sp. JCM 19037]|uniref:S9 family peptidase n=1 Tax=Geomicrobium sp. JCM 19037 TaxID=1460634 RepID=UPI00045F1F14|nr:S9 family peptidase [Geomicrobium sp. JCM 19037]GAK06085.1 acylamino-acid-releasing enzyme [Geomicrobium sp. JCM 19037]
MYLSPKELIEIPQYPNVALSGDGRNVAFEERTTDWKKNEYRRHVRVYNRETKTSTPMTIGNTDSRAPRWSPDDAAVAYLSPIDGKDQIFIQKLSSTGTVQHTSADEGVEQYEWATDGNGIYYVSKRPLSKTEKERNDTYGVYTYQDEDFRYHELYYQSLDGDAVPLLQGLNVHIHSFAVSGARLVISAAPTPRVVDGVHQAVRMYDFGTERWETLVEDCTGNARLSPDGSKVCYTHFRDPNRHTSNNQLAVYDVNSKTSKTIDVPIDEHVTPVNWTSRGMFIQWAERTKLCIGFVDEAGRVEPMHAGSDGVVMLASTNGESIAYTRATSTEPYDIYIDDQRVTNNSTHFTDKQLVQKEIITWTTAGGEEIEGILSKPADWDHSKTYPLIVAVHGGPAGTSFALQGVNRYQPIESFIEEGFLVLEPNYRGSAGYGKSFRGANVKNLGIGDYEDVISGIDLLGEQGMIDPENVGIIGWSQGGYIAAFCATYSDRFKAASVGAGVTNWYTYYTNTDITSFTPQYLANDPWIDPDIYARTSPMTYVRNGAPPTLIQHGEADVRVPVANAYELYRGLKDTGQDVKMAIFKQMPHGATKPGQSLAIMEQNIEWFREKMKN